MVNLFDSANLVMGIYYESGLHVSEDLKKAHKYYNSAAEMGNLLANIRLGMIHKGTDEDKIKIVNKAINLMNCFPLKIQKFVHHLRWLIYDNYVKKLNPKNFLKEFLS